MVSNILIHFINFYPKCIQFWTSAIPCIKNATLTRMGDGRCRLVSTINYTKIWTSIKEYVWKLRIYPTLTSQITSSSKLGVNMKQLIKYIVKCHESKNEIGIIKMCASKIIFWLIEIWSFNPTRGRGADSARSEEKLRFLVHFDFPK